ncbi:hypothetical protein DICPUDRAFT_79778 [Dictyostelium purpureum]|uniref:Frizzled/Smoothened 7TM domain-containing protein n=1 Tax=Dictyostelium purpureum TaxID=5786 RepID=F0ZNL2_DICPU|nr:uncharacterized protein DICPUDRAFT_79778 [Dictyostelium purpureum]EGC34462.1 hypothetical protein DICPUDRAFT_79778 [Dictyostelium purpureum]|eukprot:XP_003288997.1 hypothetical protein DICPUDRAFT_79778 [Dictyostelium purpureum]
MLKIVILIFVIVIINIALVSGENCPYPLKYREKGGLYVESEDFHNVDYTHGYVYASGSKNETNCLLPCPGPIYKEEHLSKLSYLSKISGTICFVSSAIILKVSSPILNKPPFNKQTLSKMFLALGIFCFTLTDVFYFAVGEKLICPSKHKYARQSDIGCGITGVLFQYGSLSAIFWWFSLVLDLFLRSKKIGCSANIEKYNAIAIQVISIFLTFIPFARYGYGYYVSGITCWILDEIDTMFFFWIPYIIFLSLGSIFIIFIAIYIYRISKEQKVNERKGLVSILVKQYLSIIFIWIQFLLLLGFCGTISLNMDQYNEKMGKYIDCLIEKSDNRLCNLETIPFELEFSVLFFLRFIGFEILILFTILVPNQTLEIIRSNKTIRKIFRISKHSDNFYRFRDNEHELSGNINSNKLVLK